MATDPLPLPLPPDPAAPLPGRPYGCNCHAHVFARLDRFPRDPERTYDPADLPLTAWLNSYRAHQAALGLDRGVLVQSLIYQDAENAVTAAALSQLDQRRYVGVALLGPGDPAAQIARLAPQGFRAARLNLTHPGAPVADRMIEIGRAAAEAGWHVEIQCHLASQLPLVSSFVSQCPADVVIDHYGKLPQRDDPDAIDDAAARSALDWMTSQLMRRRIWVKLSAPYQGHDGPADEASNLLAPLLVNAGPDRVLWGSDWPHPGTLPHQPDATALLADLAEQLVWTDLHRVLVDNPARLYGFPAPARDDAPEDGPGPG